MAKDNFNDYEELLSMFEDERKADSPKPTDEEALKTKRQKKVDDFKIDINSNSAYENPNYKGGVYFSNPPRDIDKAAQREKRATVRKNQRAKPGVEKFRVSAPPTTAKQNKAIADKKARNEKFQKTFLGKFLTYEKLSKLALAVAIIVLSSVVLCIYGINCINDVLAIDVDETAVEVEVSKGMSDSDVIDILKDNKLIKNELFCNLFIKFFGKDGDYVSGVYTLTPSMGVEKMLSTMKADITLSETVTLTFPEGWTIDQIAEKLEANEVCTAASFINTLQNVDFSEEYSFIKSIPNKELRFRVLEGYMYPDTYEFYVGENASSVVRRFLDNFKNRWTDEYAKQAEDRGLSLDEVIIMASILQEEAASSSQMADIASVLYNRLDRPATFPWLNCDSTEDYLTETIKPTLTSSTEDIQKYIQYRDNYDTYSEECKGLPVGAIANPGDAAIRAALKPSSTSYYYFCHNTETGDVFYANTMSEHESNMRKAGLS
ncbi:MAG: endolytic transglycosylase MltG [Clostridia bacterium]|nr:endolytic transglycosylase MltG [Clostridia bacterium]